MATLEKIRSKAGVLVAAIIGLSLLAFILTDFLDSRKSIFTKANNNVAVISGKKIDIQDLEKKVADMLEIYKIQNPNGTPDDKITESFREQAWERILNDNVMGTEYDKLGLDVSGDELYDNIAGVNVNPIIRNAIVDPQTGQFSRENLNNFLKYTTENPTSKQNTFLIFIEDYIKTQLLNAKYITCVKKGLTIPTFMAKDEFFNANYKVDLNFVVQRYSTVADNAVKYSDDDLKNYYKEHKYQYEQVASKDIQYVTFDILPSAEDQKATKEWIDKIRPDFVACTDAEQFVNSSSDVPFDNKSYKKDQLSDTIKDFMFNESEGAVFGPYFENGSYKLARLDKILFLPDSVKARHILIQPKPKSQDEVERATTNAKSLADSILNILQKDKKADFGVLASRFSDDKNSAVKGGELGWFSEGQMVPEFNDAAFSLKKGEMKIIETKYGYHIIQVLDRSKEEKKVKVAIIERKLNPSNGTNNKIYHDAMKFAADNRTLASFLRSAEKQKLAPKSANNLTESERTIPGLDTPRPLLKWISSAKQGDVSDALQLGDHFVVAAIFADRAKGIAPLDQVKSDVEVKVIKEKKSALIAANLKKAAAGLANLQDLSLKLNTSVETVSGISFNSYSLGNFGVEPKVVAYASVFPKNRISQPIEGNNGVFIIYTNNVTLPEGNNYGQAKQRLNFMYEQRAAYDIKGSLTKLADVQDLRAKFY